MTSIAGDVPSQLEMEACVMSIDDAYNTVVSMLQLNHNILDVFDLLKYITTRTQIDGAVSSVTSKIKLLLFIFSEFSSHELLATDIENDMRFRLFLLNTLRELIFFSDWPNNLDSVSVYDPFKQKSRNGDLQLISIDTRTNINITIFMVYLGIFDVYSAPDDTIKILEQYMRNEYPLIKLHLLQSESKKLTNNTATTHYRYRMYNTALIASIDAPDDEYYLHLYSAFQYNTHKRLIINLEHILNGVQSKRITAPRNERELFDNIDNMFF